MPELRDEKELEDYLFEVYTAKEDGFTTLRQFALSAYGTLDIFRYKIEKAKKTGEYLCEFQVIELKKGDIGYTEVGQILRYRTGIEKMVAYFENKLNIHIYAETQCHLIGRKVVITGDFVFLINELIKADALRISVYDISLSGGIKFEAVNSGWFISKADFNNQEDLFKKQISDLSITPISDLEIEATNIFKKALKEVDPNA